MENTTSFAAYKKSPNRSIKHSTYFETYDELFARYRGKPITFVEIGVLGGGSLFMWREFFGEQARIIGIDLNPNAKKWEKDGFEIFIGSQSDEAFWQEVKQAVGPMDVVLDDGGHTYEQQIVTTEMLLDNIKDGGMLVVEDTHTSYMPGFGPKKYSFMRYVAQMMDRMHYRFSKISGPTDNRVWSVQVFESIVAFHINRDASNRVSAVTDNGGAHDNAVDFRHADNSAYGRLSRVYRESDALKKIPGVRPLALFVKDVLSRAKGSGRVSRFFR